MRPPISICEALLLEGEPRRLLNMEAPAALSLAEETGDRKRAAKTCYLAMWALNWETCSLFNTDDAPQWVERTNRYAESDPITGIWGDIGSGILKFFKGVGTGFDAAVLAESARLFTNALNTGTQYWRPRSVVVGLLLLSSLRYDSGQSGRPAAIGGADCTWDKNRY